MADNQETYRVTVNGLEFTFTDADLNSVDIIQRDLKDFHIVSESRSFHATLRESADHGKSTVFESDGEQYEVSIKDQLQVMLETMGFGKAINSKASNIKAPMPGLVLDILVKEGQEINVGDKILVLGAMKMENSILAQSPGKIKKLKVSIGEAVDKNQVLVEFE